MKRILILSIDSWNKRSGSDTFSTLFKTFDSKDMANIYVRPEKPDSSVCSRYLNINEWSVMKSALLRKIDPCKETFIEAIIPSEKRPIDNPSVEFKRIRLFLWMRELGWKFGKWKSSNLSEFLDDFAPDVVVFPIEGYPYFNRISQYVVDYCKPSKAIGFLWDDNFTYKQYPNDLLFKFERYFLRKQIKHLVKSCSNILAISPKMKEECDAEFGVESIVLTKPIFNQGDFEEYNVRYPIHILYTGKLNIGREFTVIKIVSAIKKINLDEQKIILDVYTNTILNDELKKQIEVPNCCVLHDPVLQTEVASLQKEADVLLFAESLSDNDLTARLSFSTKLTDYFAAGKCVWAVGNKDLGPISYIQDENAGFVSTSDESIISVFESFAKNPSIIGEYARKSYDCGKRNHDGERIIGELKRILKYN